MSDREDHPLMRVKLIGMVHLPPLPGSPGYREAGSWSMERIIGHALADARTLVEAGFDGLMMENFGDAPFRATEVDPHTVACMTRVGAALRAEVRVPLGINVLRNDAISALAIASVIGASFVRVNVHCGVYATDQGIIEGRADETLRYREMLAASVCEGANVPAIFADVMVKHARPMSTTSIAEAAEETAYRGRADGLIVSGSATGKPTSVDDIRAVREAVPDRLLCVGSGVTAETVCETLAIADSVIIGTAVKENGKTTAPVNAELAKAAADSIYD